MRPWSRHYQYVWQERSADRNLPDWLRISFAALGAHRANGHARFSPGALGDLLGRVDRDTGEVIRKDKHNVQRAIRHAIKAGYLAEGSSSLCLIVPGHAVEGGFGNPHQPCDLHDRRRRRAGGSPVDPPRTTGGSVTDPPGGSVNDPL